MSDRLVGLCRRCEHRQRILDAMAEGKEWTAPRCECGDVAHAVVGCYMYLPTLPVIVRTERHEKRPVFAAYMIAGRVEGVRVATRDDVGLALANSEDGYIIPYIKPKKRRGKGK